MFEKIFYSTTANKYIGSLLHLIFYEASKTFGFLGPGDASWALRMIGTSIKRKPI